MRSSNQRYTNGARRSAEGCSGETFQHAHFMPKVCGELSAQFHSHIQQLVKETN